MAAEVDYATCPPNLGITYLKNPLVRKPEIGRILHLDGHVRNTATTHSLRRQDYSPREAVQSDISVFGFEMQDSSNFRFFWQARPRETGVRPYLPPDSGIMPSFPR